MVDELAEDKAAVSVCPKVFQYLAERLQFRGGELSVGEDERAVTACAPQLHQLGEDNEALILSVSLLDSFERVPPERLVEASLLRVHIHAEGDLRLRRQLVEHLVLGAAEQEGAEDLLQPGARSLGRTASGVLQ